MPGRSMNNTRTATITLPLTALATLLALAALGGCSPRQPIPLDTPRIATKAPDEALAQPEPAKPKAPKAAKQAKATPAKPAEHKPGEPAAAAEQTPVLEDKGVAETPAAPAVAERKNYVQVGAFGTAMNALGAVAWLKGKGFENSRMVRVEQGQGAVFRVQAGPFQDLAAAHKALEALKPDWPQAFIPLD